MTREDDLFDNTEIGAALGGSLPPVEPPAYLRAQILEAIAHTPQMPVADNVAHDHTPPASMQPGLTGHSAGEPEYATGEIRVENPVGQAPTTPVHALPTEEAAPTSSTSAHKGNAKVVPIRHRPRTARTFFSSALRVAAAFVLLGGGVGIGRWSAMDSMDSTMSYAKLNQMQDVARIEHTMDDGHVATLTWSADMEMTALTLPAQMSAPAGQTLQVWKRINGVVTSAGTYSPDRGAVFSFIDAMPEPGLEVFITLEPAGGSAQPTSPPLVVLNVSENTVSDSGGVNTPIGEESHEVKSTSILRPAGHALPEASVSHTRWTPTPSL